MIILEGIIIRDDARYQYARDYLERRNFIFREPGEPPENFGFIIFPFKEKIKPSLYDDSYFKKLKPCIQVFSGVRDHYIAGQCAEKKLNYHVIMEDSSVTVKNAIPTTEGVISYLIANRIDTVFNSRVLISGYGTCGKDLAKRLKALDSRVYTLVRNREKEAEAVKDAITPVYLHELKKINVDVVINTVPSPVFTNEMLEKFRGALMIEIASKPFGFDMEYAKKLNEKSAFLPGIPGKYAVRTAGEIIGEFIYSKAVITC